MPGWALKTYIAMYGELCAEQRLAAIQISDAPHLTASARADIFRDLRAGLPSEPAERATPEKLAAAGIAVEYVTADDEEAEVNT
jgi:hypothetical protein